MTSVATAADDARRKHHAIDRHARLRQNLRIHHDDVGHRDKRGQSAKKFPAHRGLIFRKTKVAFDQSSSLAASAAEQCCEMKPTFYTHVGDSRLGCPVRTKSGRPQMHREISRQPTTFR